jgi:putative hemolysin
MKNIRPYSAFFALCMAAGFTLAAAPSSALEVAQAIEKCRASSGKPAYMACKQGGGSHEACFDKSRSIVQSCVKSAMAAVAAKIAPVTVEKLAAPSAAEIASDASASLVAPPRTISDISAILDQQKPDPAAIAKLTATADAAVPAGLKGGDLGEFYYKRAQARTLLGRGDSLDDAELAVANATKEEYKNKGSRYEQLLIRRLRDQGQNKRANTLLAKQVAAFASASLGKGKMFGLNYSLALGYLKSGDVNTAESYIARNRTLLAEAQQWSVFPIYSTSWKAMVEDGNGRIAEAAYHKAAIQYTDSLRFIPQWESKPGEGEMERFADWSLALEGRAKVKLGRVGEGEADVRRALLSRLSKSG